jgi:hypothetical protein
MADSHASVEVLESHLRADHMPVATFRGKERLESITVGDYRKLSAMKVVVKLLEHPNDCEAFELSGSVAILTSFELT